MMEDTTVQKATYPFCNKYTDDDILAYGNLALQALEVPVKERIHVLAECETRDSHENGLYKKGLELFSLKRKKSDLNYMCQSSDWIGYVVDIREDSFTAQLMDNKRTTVEIAEFDIRDVSKGDLPLLDIGAVFYWSVGYANLYGQVMKQSILRFKRSVGLHLKDINNIVGEAKDLEEDIRWE